jgi:hypothetical protein
MDAETDADLVQHIAEARLMLAQKLFDEGAYEDAVVAFGAVLEFVPNSVDARRGLEGAQRGLDLQTLDIPAKPEGSAAAQEPQVLQHLVAQHLSAEAASATPGGEQGEQVALEKPGKGEAAAQQAAGIELVFEEEGSIGILFEAASDLAPITVGKIKPDSQAARDVHKLAGLREGLILASVQGQPVTHLPFNDTLKLLSFLGRPLRLGFREAVDPTDAVSVAVVAAATPPRSYAAHLHAAGHPRADAHVGRCVARVPRIRVAQRALPRRA